MPRTIAPYGSWLSPLDLRALFEKPSSPLYPVSYRGRYFWIEARAVEGGRLVLIRQNTDGSEDCLTPPGFNIRTRVHEYGGRCYVLGRDCVIFSNDSDRRLYRQSLDPIGFPEPLTADTDGAVAFADLRLSPKGYHLIAVMESMIPGDRNRNELVALSLQGRSLFQPSTIAQGADFYANPAVDGNDGRLAWIQWDHPHMPWDQTTLVLADIIEDEAGLELNHLRSIVDDQGSSVCQLAFYGSELIFAMDKTHVVEPCDDYWNLYRYGDDGIGQLTCDTKDYGAPHWAFGESNHAAMDAATLVARRIADGEEELVTIDRISGKQHSIDSRFNALSQLSEDQGSDHGGVLLVAASATELPQLMGLDRRGWRCIKAVDAPIPVDEISQGTPVRYPTRDRGVAHAYYYVPHNTLFAASDDQLPPLLVMVHGGPTGRASSSLDLSRQYWTGIGFAILDVNHRGSTGYGRRYRQHLLGKWGRVDIDDIVDGIDYLVNQSLVDPEKILIRGKSAGGYTVLRALTEYPQYFCAGACYYGIGNLSTLAAHTHKFEARYTDRLIGEAYDEATAADSQSEYYRRSPIHFMHKVRSPMILFQGAEDAVVPPRLSREVVAVLDERGIDHEYVEYPGEGHGFRKSETNIDAIQRETGFYRRILGLPATEKATQ